MNRLGITLIIIGTILTVVHVVFRRIGEKFLKSGTGGPVEYVDSDFAKIMLDAYGNRLNELLASSAAGLIILGLVIDEINIFGGIIIFASVLIGCWLIFGAPYYFRINAEITRRRRKVLDNDTIIVPNYSKGIKLIFLLLTRYRIPKGIEKFRNHTFQDF